MSSKQRAVLLDTNLLLVLVVGSRDHERIGRAKGTQEYRPSDSRPKESQRPAVDVVRDPLYVRLGLTDAAIARVASRRRCVVWTNDQELYRSSVHRGVTARYYADVRRQFADR